MTNLNKTKPALVTGGSGDIGRAICRALAEKGYSVAIHYMSNSSSALELENELNSGGYPAKAFRADLRSEEEIDRMLNEIESTLGNVSVLVNNAGISLIKLFDETTLSEWNDIININLTGAFLVSKRCIKNMIHEKSGSIINVSSMWGQVGASCEVAYSASKGGLIAMTKALAQEVGLSGITVNCVSPGMIDTKMNSHLSEEDVNAIREEIPLGAIGTPDDVAKACAFLADAKFITGQVLGVNGGMVL